jgi:cytochrome c peroxidase
MRRLGSRGLGFPVRTAVAVGALVLGLAWGPDHAAADGGDHGHHGKGQEDRDRIPNNHPSPNPGGFGATFSTEGFVDLTGEYFQAQGTNGRSCRTCHVPEEAWAITPHSLQRLFRKTDGLHPVFNPLDANNPTTGDFTTEHGRRAAYSMLLKHGVFRRGGAPRANSEWELIAVDDPHGFARLPNPLATPADPGQIVQWRRAMPTINFALGSATINWDGGNNVGTDQLGGLENQARRNVTGAQQGPALPVFPAPLAPPFDAIIPDILGFETSLFTAQLIVPGVGRLDKHGARGGPEALSTMTKVAGRFDLFDAWIGDRNRKRAQIARGQELFNNPNQTSTGPRCGGCHSSANNGTSIGNVLFDIRTASADARTPDLPLYTVCRRPAPGVSCAGDPAAETRQLTDLGRGQVTGLWNDLARFKTPTIRGLAARAPYFHNGIAETLEDVVRHYERFLGFQFTNRERDDLVAFLNAL